jgi:hypothetical protein
MKGWVAGVHNLVMVAEEVFTVRKLKGKLNYKI